MRVAGGGRLQCGVAHDTDLPRTAIQMQPDQIMGLADQYLARPPVAPVAATGYGLAWASVGPDPGRQCRGNWRENIPPKGFERNLEVHLCVLSENVLSKF